jgi:hypothetical protein
MISVGDPIPHVVDVKAIGPLTLFVTFDDGVEGRVLFEKKRLRGMAKILANPDYFAGVYLSHGAVTWPDERYDMCPDTMHKEILAGDGEWLATGPFKYMPEVTNAGREVL